jgi:mRNA interferase MazF
VKRGDIVATVGRGDFSNKPRPSLVVQADEFNAHHPAITVCPISGLVTGNYLYRVPLSPTADNGLVKESEVEIDLVQAIRRERIGQTIGHVPEETMFNVDQALRRWLAL